MSLAVSSDNRKMVVGFVDGSLMVRTRNLEGDGALGSSSSGAVKNRRQGMFYKGEGIGHVCSRVEWSGVEWSGAAECE
jgi:hypothetical protein